eukprot:9051298-Pyramimonas_sp.AAC.1
MLALIKKVSPYLALVQKDLAPDLKIVHVYAEFYGNLYDGMAIEKATAMVDFNLIRKCHKL